jgi:hypothetical protein
MQVTALALTNSVVEALTMLLLTARSAPGKNGTISQIILNHSACSVAKRTQSHLGMRH